MYMQYIHFNQKKKTIPFHSKLRHSTTQALAAHGLAAAISQVSVLRTIGDRCLGLLLLSFESHINRCVHIYIYIYVYINIYI